MTASLRALLTGIVDYAGLFPPAGLPMEQAIRNYARYRTEPESWMLGRFVCPAARLEELTPYRELFQSGLAFALAGIGRGGKTIEDFLTGVQADLKAIEAFQTEYGGRAVVDVFEVKVPDEALSEQDSLYLPDLAAQLPGYLREMAGELGSKELATLGAGVAFGRLLSWTSELLASADLPRLTPYYEMPWTPTWRATWSAGLVMLGILNQTASTFVAKLPYHRPGGVKLRCGGLEAKAFPSTEQLAGVLATCRDRAVSFKATAGLHHPLRHFSVDLQTRMHGFLNVFAAATLTHAHRLDEDQVRAILEDEDVKSFRFDEDAMRWKDRAVKTAKISEARNKFAISFGSCSFDEPRQDLRELGLL